MNERPKHPADGVSRRRILGLSCLACAGAAGCGQPGGSQPTGPIAAGKVKDVPVGTFRVMGEIVLARDAGGLYAMSAICTHAGCPTRTTAAGLYCPCHGSYFDHDGQVTRGPARASLPHFQIDVSTEGLITVQASAIVAPETRLQPA
jgi:Rieske Fe-S protein